MEPVQVPPADGQMTRSMMPNIRQLGPNIVVAGILPFVAYSIIRPHLQSDAAGLAIVMIFPILEVVWERRRSGRFEPIGIIAMVGITLGLIGALVTGGNATLLKIRESAITGVFGLVCLVSLAWTRPMMWYLGREFATGGDEEKRVEFDRIWEFAGARRRFRIVTAVWGLGLIGEAIGRTIMALSLSTGVFLIVSFVFNGVVLAALFGFTVVFSRRGEAATRAEMERLGVAPPTGFS